MEEEQQDSIQHEVIEREEDAIPTEVAAARSAKKTLSWSMSAMGLLVLISVIAIIAFLVLVVRGIQNQPEADPFADYQELVDEREANIDEILSQEVEAIDRGFADTYSIRDDDFGTKVSVTVGANERTIISNSIPNHTTGAFPNSNNPNGIEAQQFIFDLPRNPVKNDEPTTYNVPQPFGIAINGIIFDPYVAEYYNNIPSSGWQLTGIVNDLGFDSNNAHVQPDGTYHYHGSPSGLLDNKTVQLIGFAGDGYLIYGPYGYSEVDSTKSEIVKLKSSYRVKSGNRGGGPGGNYDGTYEEDYEYVEGLGDLDQCNGRFSVTDEYPEGIYHYVVTDSYPYVPRCFWADVGEDFINTGPTGVSGQQS